MFTPVCSGVKMQQMNGKNGIHLLARFMIFFSMIWTCDFSAVVFTKMLSSYLLPGYMCQRFHLRCRAETKSLQISMVSWRESFLMAPAGESSRVGRVSLLVQSQFTRSAVRAVSHFQAAPSLCFKARLNARLLIWK